MLRHVAAYGDPQERKSADLALGRLRVPTGTPALNIRRDDRGSKALRRVRRVFDAGGSELLPGRLVLADPSFENAPDVHAAEAFVACGATFDLFATAFHRNSIDNRGMTIDSTVHYGQGFANAFWNGRQMIFGDGDGRLFNRFTIDIATVGHELAHGVIQHSVRLPYRGEAGALCEHLADVFGIMAKQFALGVPARDSDWLIGRDLLGPAVRGSAIRSMLRPGCAYDDPVLGRDPQPFHMHQYDRTPEDNGGVHINSGIPNFAFALASSMLGGFTWEVLGRVWYRVLTTRLRPDATFKLFATDTMAVATEWYGPDSEVVDALGTGWSSAGVRFSLPPVRRKRFDIRPQLCALCAEPLVHVKSLNEFHKTN